MRQVGEARDPLRSLTKIRLRFFHCCPQSPLKRLCHLTAFFSTVHLLPRPLGSIFSPAISNSERSSSYGLTSAARGFSFVFHTNRMVSLFILYSPAPRTHTASFAEVWSIRPQSVRCLVGSVIFMFHLPCQSHHRRREDYMSTSTPKFPCLVR